MTKQVGIDTDISIADQMQFQLATPDADGCFNNPYKVNRVVIYFVERDFTNGTKYNEFNQYFDDPILSASLAEATEAACDSPTEENLAAIEIIKQKIANSRVTSSFFYKEAKPVAIFGFEDDDPATENFPAWLNPDMVPSEDVAQVNDDNILALATDEDDEVLDARFILEWNPLGMREGDYFICWTWQPQVAGNSLSAHMSFKLAGATQLTTVLPSHQTNPDKYDTLLERYLPSMFKSVISENDLTPEVIQELQKSIAKGFTFVEDQANQVIDLLDANATHESLLPLLGNMFNTRLKSGDPTLWRRQILRAIPNYKQKGTYSGLEEALDEAGIKLNKFTRLWQIVSPYTYQDYFLISEDEETEFELTNAAIVPIDANNLEVYYRAADDAEWEQLASPTDYLSFSVDGLTVSWSGDLLSFGAIALSEGDSIRIVYQIEEIPGTSEQTLEDYIRSLPIADLRDERDQDYPIKNWNVRVIEEDDPLFNLLIPVRHPFHDDIIYGKIRTEFPYSENVYNMEEYNGSKRDSRNPCDIDRNFVDSCQNCQSSLFNIDIEIEELANDRVVEAQQAIDEFVPFHAVLHTINFSGSINEFLKSPIEEITALIQFQLEDTVLAGEGQHIFNRVIPQADALQFAKRNMLSTLTTAVTGGTGTAKNASIVIFSPGTSTTSDLYEKTGNAARFETYHIDNTDVGNPDPADNSNLLEILAPGPNAGNYTIDNVDGFMADIVASDAAISEPVDTGQFTFRVSNKVLVQNPADITQDNLFIFDADENFGELGIKTQFDVDFTPDYSGGVWQIDLSGYGTYDVLNALPDGTLILLNDGSLPTTDQSDLDWSLLDDSAVLVASSNDGTLDVTNRGRVDFDPGASSSIDDIRNFIRAHDYLLYSGTFYKINSFVSNETHQLYIEDYSSGNAAGAEVVVYRRLIENAVGQFGYRGLILETSVDQEAALPIQNGTNEVSTPTEENEFKENYLILLEPVGSPDLTDPTLAYYTINEIDGTTITINGPSREFTTAGTAVTYNIYQFLKEPLSLPERTIPPIPGHDFDYQDDPPLGLGGHVDRSGSEVITLDIETATPMTFYATVLNAANFGGNETLDVVEQNESISYTIEYSDSTQTQGEV